MGDKQPNKTLSLSIARERDHERLCKICHALSAPERVKILHFLQYKNRSLSEISKEIDIPFSSVLRHIDVLLDANIISINYQPSPKGHAKYCALKLLHFETFIEDNVEEENTKQEMLIEMPIGMFSDYQISSPCGMLGKEGPIGEMDDPEILYSPERAHAECIWFTSGYITYNFPMSHIRQINTSELSFTFELCSEAPYHNNMWPSDITISVNKIELLTYTSPGDFGGRRGKYTPNYWPLTSTQYGLLKKITINEKGVFLDNKLVNTNITFKDLNLLKNQSIEFKLEVKKDAKHCGGINLFGANFGDFPQHIIMKIR